MYDDDDIVDTAQTMPWFDPKYLASGKDDVRSIYIVALARPVQIAQLLVIGNPLYYFLCLILLLGTKFLSSGC